MSKSSTYAKKPGRARAVAIGAAILLSLSAARAEAEKVNVVASFSIIGDLANEVGGERIALRTLVGPNGDAHVYEPRPSDAIAMARADVVLVNGLQLEGFITRLVEASGATAPVVEVTQGTDIIRDPAGGHYHYNGGKATFHEAPFDPHAWQSIANGKVYVRNIAKAFCAADAEGCDTYNGNAEAYVAKLSALEGELKAAVEAVPRDSRTFVVGHNAFRYLERDFGLTFLSPQGTSTGSEPSAAAVGSIIDQMKDKRAAAIFAENISDDRLVRQIAREAGLSVAGVLYSDALSPADGPAPTYIAMMRHNIDTILKASRRD